MTKRKTIGILGGTGPVAGVNMCASILQYAQEKYSASQDTDYPSMILYSLPLAGITEKGIEDPEIAKKDFIFGLKTLETSGCDFIIIACNTIHVFYEEVSKIIRIPILNMITVTTDAVDSSRAKSIGVLASETTNDKGLYADKLASLGIHAVLVTPKTQDMVNNIILHVMSGTITEDDKNIFLKIIIDLVAKGVDGVIIGCTELSVISKLITSPAKLYDSTVILATRAVEIALN